MLEIFYLFSIKNIVICLSLSFNESYLKRKKIILLFSDDF